MGKYQVIIKATAEKDLSNHKKSGDLASIKKIIKILNELKDHPYTGSGNPEPLKFELSGYWSRRINKKDRLIYEVRDEIVTVFVISALGHYS
ncbi:toxin YoeB [Flavobacterium succinicans]|jgi:toxin YoeB|uniref:Putative mRNA interferase YoeB n=1 Tax=Flavobacterium succinicans TaxID=29536 RepID=A0A1I4VX56_9FLAO|nr:MULTISPECIES: Txe/YoeB family addiction module toxin [Flavobacterium]OOV21162.1 addiction module toxin YoeB [Flavobacterium sp. LM5]OOV25479.1 addiction module toxin YoeB [Flavobacterium sp. LM5]SFN05539.1 toxin YoeB [Flavobacterium succinicans]